MSDPVPPEDPSTPVPTASDPGRAPGAAEAGGTPAARPAERRWFSGRAWLRRLARLSVWLGPAIVAVVAVAFISPMLSEPMRRLAWLIHPPQSYVFVDSPEVYTRERLINERLDEEAWLNRQMTSIDAATGLVTFSDRDRAARSASLGGGDPPALPVAGDAAVAETPAGGTSPGLAFDQAFKLKSAYRNLIRQRLIENKLDDRHDLYGNALYILKFDTTAVSIPAARQFAEVEVTIKPPSEAIRPESVPAVQPAGAAAAANPGGTSELDRLQNAEVFHLMDETFGEWLRSIDYRIDTQIDTLYNAFMRGKWTTAETAELRDYIARKLTVPLASRADAVSGGGIADDLSPFRRLREDALAAGAEETAFVLQFKTYFVKRALSDSLGIALEDVADPSAGVDGQFKLDLPVLQELLNISGKFSEVPYFPPSITVSGAEGVLYAIDKRCISVYGPIIEKKISNGQMLFFSGEIDDRFVLISVGQEASPLALDQSRAALRLFRGGGLPGRGWQIVDYTPMLASLGAEPGGGPAACAAGPAAATGGAPGPAAGQVYGINLRNGLLTFTRKISGSGTYSYSVLPRESPVAVMTEIIRTNRASGRTSAAAFDADENRRRDGVELRPTLTTFGRVSPADDEGGPQGEPVVGWIIDPSAMRVDGPGDSELAPIAESTLAIVSVPAWWPEIRLAVATRWLDAEGNTVPGSETQSTPFAVKLPNRHELVDTLLIEDARRGPIITGFDCGGCEGATPPTTCTPQILIQGHRLWRNTAVTIGSEKAVRVEVMPNMDGLVATFAPSTSNRKGRLRVWTSQGVADLPEERELQFISPGRTCGPGAAE